MGYKLYTFTGLTKCDGTTKSISLYEVIKEHSKLFENHYMGIDSYNANTILLFENKLFCFEANCYEMESIQDCIEKGTVIIPFSRTYFIMDLISYYEQGFDVMFMKIKDYKQFKKDYGDSLITVEDNRVQPLF